QDSVADGLDEQVFLFVPNLVLGLRTLALTYRFLVAMYAHNRSFLRATLIVSALMPATAATAADFAAPSTTDAGLDVDRLLWRRQRWCGGWHRNILRSARTVGIR